ncbi:MAG: hypothetical protein ACLPWS_01385 [Rhodomicrobium sp.]
MYIEVSWFAELKKSFIGETWIKTNMGPLRGWGPKGKRLRRRNFGRHGS